MTDDSDFGNEQASDHAERVLLSRVTARLADSPAHYFLLLLSVPHWFNDRVLNQLSRPVPTSVLRQLEDLDLIGLDSGRL
jgi:uncharacterized protein (DUF1778 family)